MKHIYLIGGTMGVGKTTVCQIMKSKSDDCVYLDGDWCWDMNPFIVTGLICDSSTLSRRLEKDIKSGYREHDIIERSLSRQKMYQNLNTIKMDTSNLSPDEVARYIIEKY